MKSKKLKLYPILLFLMFLCLVLLGTGCNNEITETEPDEDEPDEEVCDYETTETDPAKLIIGKWVKTKVKDIPVVKNNPDDNDYWEFGPDSLAKWQSLRNGELNTNYLKYWVDSLLHYSREGGFPLTPWYYEFPDNCTLWVGNAFLSISPISYTFKRIEP